MWRMRLVLVVGVLLMGSRAFGEVKRDVEYGEAGSEKLLLDVGVPGDVKDGEQLPVAVVVHGGGWSGGDKGKDIVGLLEEMTKEGVVCFSVNYRLAPKNKWPACYDDVVSAVKWVKGHAGEYHGDAGKVVVVGYSAGGQIVFLGAVKGAFGEVKGIVGLAPPTDLELDLPTRGGLSPSLQGLLGRPHELTEEGRQELKDISALDQLVAKRSETQLPGFLIVHGDADKSVPYQGTLNFAGKLKELGVGCEVITLKGGMHNILTWDKVRAGWEGEVVGWVLGRVRVEK